MTALTDQEWDNLQTPDIDFPNLVRAQTLKTGDETEDYNCIAFALGIFDDWVNPGDDQAEFNKQCECS
jgi:hypothetical protein